MTSIGLNIANAQPAPPPGEVIFLGRQEGLAATSDPQNLFMEMPDNRARPETSLSIASFKRGRIGNKNSPDLDLNYEQLRVPLSKEWKLEINGAQLHGEGTIQPGVHLDYRQRDTGGSVIWNKEKYGVALSSAYLSTQSEFTIEGLGGFTIKSRPDGIGGKVAGFYQLNDHLAIQGTYTRYGDKSVSTPRGIVALFVPKSENRYLTKELTSSFVYTSRSSIAHLSYTNVKIDQINGSYSLSKDWVSIGGGRKVNQVVWVYGGLSQNSYSVGLQAQHKGWQASLGLSQRGRNLSDDATTNYYVALRKQM